MPDRQFTEISRMKKGMLFFFLVVLGTTTIVVVANLSWLGSIDSTFETVGEDNFKSGQVSTIEKQDGYTYRAKFTHTGYTNIDSSNVSVSVSFVSNGDLRQFNLSGSKANSRFGEYSVQLSGFLVNDKVQRSDESIVEVNSPHRFSSISICVLYNNSPVVCSEKI